MKEEKDGETRRRGDVDGSVFDQAVMEQRGAEDSEDGENSINEVRTCQLNPGQIEEANVCFNVTASSQRGLGSGLTPGLTALPDHILKDRPEEMYCFFVGDLLTGQLAVEPPTNVTLDCDNMVYSVKWNYTEFSPGLKFRIWIGSMSSGKKEFLVDSPNLQANFSIDTDPADSYSLLVSAVVGDNESDDAPRGGIQFSYYKNSVASKKYFTYIIYIMVSLVVFITLALIFFMLYKKLTAPSTSLPDMTLKGHLWRAVGVRRDQFSVPVVEPASPTPLLSPTEIPPAITSPAEPELRGPIGVMTEDNVVCEDGEIGGDERSGYTQGTNLEEDDAEIKESSGYESRPVFD
ncbi:hypothetical protein GBF38_002434 [Nibea albiflora]|uniref:Uncharacterized protein n=1 Tax=Nibea albiflora TaxID=240163 RepID=A0ACB7EEB5_NIBAL|nr:hypothetical protein GBF38_002434 [Nibea albiflora]